MDARRPIKTRSAEWAQRCSQFLCRFGITPNLVSVVSVAFALLVAGCYWASDYFESSLWQRSIFLLGAAIGIQLRLICNLMDGMIAIEGGKATRNGDIYNEIPDRFADLIIIVAAGIWAGDRVYSDLAWLAGALSILIACIRMQGAALTQEHDFSGPMAKPQRMALLTLVTLLLIALGCFNVTLPVMFWALLVLIVGEALTIVRRIRNLSIKLGGHQPK